MHEEIQCQMTNSPCYLPTDYEKINKRMTIFKNIQSLPFEIIHKNYIIYIMN